MTIVVEEKKLCGLCNSENKFRCIATTNAFGSKDLDTRPPEMQRSTMFTWVQRCSKCGYCASNVSKSRPGFEAVVNAEEYRKQLNDQAFPELANSFLCKAIIDRETNDYAGATWALIHAAWVCDDAHRPNEAAVCRHKAATMLVTAEDHGQQVGSRSGASTAILVDLLRRSGRTDDARRVIAERRAGITDDIITRVLDFQSNLIEKGDTSCYTISQALTTKKNFWGVTSAIRKIFSKVTKTNPKKILR